MPAFDLEVTVLLEEATTELARFDAEVGSIAAPFSAILLRTESAASSEIEKLTATAKSIAMAELGRKSGPNSRGIVSTVRAMEAAIDLADSLDTDAVIKMQRALLHETHPEYTGEWRRQQVWVGGVGNSPHSAAFVPPHYERVPQLMDDALVFARRADLPALPQIAIAHAQFETIHPFPDGNGRTGRALAQAMLRRLGITANVTVPVSAGLLRDTDSYFRALTAYRTGDPTPIVRSFATAALDAVSNGRLLVAGLIRIRSEWTIRSSARGGSAGSRLLDVLQRQPVIDAGQASAELGVLPQNAQAGIDRLVGDGILRQIGGGRRNRMYEAPEVLDALDTFAARARRSTGI